MRVQLGKMQNPSLITVGHRCERAARILLQRIEADRAEWISLYKAGQITEETIRYCLSLSGVGDDEIQEIIETL